MKRREFMTLVGGAATLPFAGAAESQAQSGSPAAAIDTVLREAVERGVVTGVVGMAADRKGTFYEGVYGTADIAEKRPLKLDSMFRIASMTKAITSTSALQLVEKGVFAIEDPVEKYLPQLKNAPVVESFSATTGDYKMRPAKRPVTVRHLMTHTSGLGYPFTDPVTRDFKAKPGEDYPLFLVFDPGERWLYSTSTDWLGRLIEKVSGKSLEDYFHEHVCAPLGMNDTSYFVPKDKEARLVTVDRRLPNGSLTKDANQPPTQGFTPIGGGGLTSTASDYLRFTRAILNGGELDGVRILSPATVKLMQENHIGDIGVPAQKTAIPERSEDFSFIDAGRDKWSLAFLITSEGVPGKRSAGSLSWGGIDNTYYWLDPARGITGTIMMQFLPFADRKALALYDGFERGVYRLADAR